MALYARNPPEISADYIYPDDKCGLTFATTLVANTDTHIKAVLCKMEIHCKQVLKKLIGSERIWQIKFINSYNNFL